MTIGEISAIAWMLTMGGWAAYRMWHGYPAQKPTEKQRRVYYQDLVYHACNCIDRVLGGSTVCGTADWPTSEFKERMDLLAKCHADTESTRKGGA